MFKWTRVIFKTWLSCLSAISFAQMQHAPVPFLVEDVVASAIDIESVHLHLEFDVAAKRTLGNAVVRFTAGGDGYALFDLVPEILAAKIGDVDIDVSDIPTIDVPGGETKMRVIKHHFAAGEMYDLKLLYDLKDGVTYNNGSIAAGFFMDDTQNGGRGLWEQYGPANLEFDQFEQYVTYTVTNSQVSHRIYTNGNVQTLSPGSSWAVAYPGFYNSASFYLHIAAEGRFEEHTAVYRGLEREVTVLVYGPKEYDIAKGLRMSLAVLAENEATFGPYAHDYAIAYITRPGTGGMEHAGATQTSLWALEHEFTHFWYARGVMPADGNAGWIDEAVASWRDDGYPRSRGGIAGFRSNPIVLGGFDIFRRHTTLDAYTYGRDLVSAFDSQFADFDFEGQNGMRGILRSFYKENATTPITVDIFHRFIETLTGSDLSEVFNRYVYGRASAEKNSKLKFAPASLSKHPRPLTKEERIEHR